MTRFDQKVDDLSNGLPLRVKISIVRVQRELIRNDQATIYVFMRIVVVIRQELGQRRLLYFTESRSLEHRTVHHLFTLFLRFNWRWLMQVACLYNKLLVVVEYICTYANEFSTIADSYGSWFLFSKKFDNLEKRKSFQRVFQMFKIRSFTTSIVIILWYNCKLYGNEKYWKLVEDIE